MPKATIAATRGFGRQNAAGPFIVSEPAAGLYLGKRNRRMLEDNRRQIAEAEERTRAHEEREAAEARKAQEADRAAYYAEHGSPT